MLRWPGERENAGNVGGPKNRSREVVETSLVVAKTEIDAAGMLRLGLRLWRCCGGGEDQYNSLINVRGENAKKTKGG